MEIREYDPKESVSNGDDSAGSNDESLRERLRKYNALGKDLLAYHSAPREHRP